MRSMETSEEQQTASLLMLMNKVCRSQTNDLDLSSIHVYLVELYT